VFGRIKLALTCLIGIAIGLLSAHYVAGGGFGLVAQADGPWRTWPSAGLNTMDPYTKAHFLATGRLPDDRREVIEYEAWSDSDGRPLDAACAYSVHGQFGRSRWWSISVTRKGAVEPRQGGRVHSLDSGEIVLEPDGTALVSVSAQAVSGNWLAMPASGHVGLLLRFYDPVHGTRERPGIDALPGILRRDCQ
jgi:hypothetical protein